MKGIICAGGKGNRLMPMTRSVSKHLFPIYDKPMIYYPLSVLMLAGITEILIIVDAEQASVYKKLLRSGNQFGIKIEYCEQAKPNGLAEALLLGKSFLANDSCCLILGDNIFYGQGFIDLLKEALVSKAPATIFLQKVDRPSQFGVAVVDEKQQVSSVEEKPKNPKSNLAITGLYVFDRHAPEIASSLTISVRNELEIVDVIRRYLHNASLESKLLGRGTVWLDMGSAESMLEAAQFVKSVQTKQGLKIACLEEIALGNGWISKSELEASMAEYKHNEYREYLKNLSTDR